MASTKQAGAVSTACPYCSAPRTINIDTDKRQTSTVFCECFECGEDFKVTIRRGQDGLLIPAEKDGEDDG